MRKSVCDMDCFNCKFDDCINDYVRPLHVIKTEKEREAGRQYRKERYARLKAEKICVDCGKNPACTDSVRCYECRIKHIRYERTQYFEKHQNSRETFRETGCYFCGEKRVKGKKVCQKHLKICRKNAENARNSKNFKIALSKNTLLFGRGIKND